MKFEQGSRRYSTQSVIYYPQLTAAFILIREICEKCLAFKILTWRIEMLFLLNLWWA